MANFTQLSNNLAIIAALADLPNATDGLTAAQLKAKFDEAAGIIKTFLNSTLIAELEAQTAANKIGAVVGGANGKIQDFINAVEAAGIGNLPPAGTITNTMMATDVKVGSLAALSTTNKTSIQASINEVVGNIGSLASLNTTAKNTLVAAINEVLSTTGATVPAGEIKYFAMTTPPSGYLKANGAAVSRTTYANLFNAIGTTFGIGDNSTTFNVPDLRGTFIRGWVDDGTYDSGRVFGSFQADDNKTHTHTGTTDSSGSHTHTVTQSGVTNTTNGTYLAGGSATQGTSSTTTTSSAGPHTHTFTTGSTGGSEVKVKNLALLACIKY